MAEIRYVRQSKNKGRLTVGVVNGSALYTLSVSEAVYYSLGNFAVGEEIDESVLRTFMLEDERFRAMKKALSILAYADNNRRSLFVKLSRAGFPREVISDTVDECVRLGYVNEEKQLVRLCLREANKSLRGAALIRRTLAAKGFSGSDVDRTLHSLCESGQINFAQNFKKLCEKKGASTPIEISRLRYSYGYVSGADD